MQPYSDQMRDLIKWANRTIINYEFVVCAVIESVDCISNKYAYSVCNNDLNKIKYTHLASAASSN